MNNNPFKCPICERSDGVPPSGPQRSPVLIIGEMPGKIEALKGKPMVGPMGEVLKYELALLGIDIGRLRLCNLWFHAKTNNENSENCLKYGAEIVIKEAKNRRAILLMGSDSVKYFTDSNVSDVNGLPVKSLLLSAPIIYASVNPAIVFHEGGLGETRFALTQFSKAIEGVL